MVNIMCKDWVKAKNPFELNELVFRLKPKRDLDHAYFIWQKRKYLYFAFSFSLFLFFFSSQALPKALSKKIEITLGTFVYSPLMYEKPDVQKRQGIGIDIIKKAFHKSDKFKLKVIIFPVKRSMMFFKNGNTDLFLGSRLDLPKIENNIIALKLFTLKSVLFCLPAYCKIANNQGNTKRLGVIASIPDSPVNEQLRSSGNKVALLLSLSSSFKFLAKKRANYVAAIDFSGISTLQTMNEAERKDIEHTNFSLLEIPYDLVIKKNHPYAEEISDLIRSAIRSANLQSNSEQLVKKYINGENLFD
jgi:hypothetical protein